MQWKTHFPYVGFGFQFIFWCVFLIAPCAFGVDSICFFIGGVRVCVCVPMKDNVCDWLSQRRVRVVVNEDEDESVSSWRVSACMCARNEMNERSKQEMKRFENGKIVKRIFCHCVDVKSEQYFCSTNTLKYSYNYIFVPCGQNPMWQAFLYIAAD